jgi:transposase, IS5 family
MRAEMRQLSLAEALVSSGRSGSRLARISDLLEWGALDGLLAGLRDSPVGRPSYPPLLLLRALLLAQWYELSDPELEEAVADRLSFRRFVGLPLDGPVPDETTFCRFRNELAAAELMPRLLAEVDRQLAAKGLVLKRGTLIDATLVRAAVRPSGSAAAPADPDAAFARREGQSGSVFGFKAHLAVDQGSGLIRQAVLTPANVNETVVADSLIQGDEAAVYGDQAYGTHARRAALAARGIKDRIMHRPNKHHPRLKASAKRRNRLIGKVRGRIETVFAVLKRHYGWSRARYVGLGRNCAHLQLLCLAINLRRVLVLGPATP